MLYFVLCKILFYLLSLKILLISVTILIVRRKFYDMVISFLIIFSYFKIYHIIILKSKYLTSDLINFN